MLVGAFWEPPGAPQEPPGAPQEPPGALRKAPTRPPKDPLERPGWAKGRQDAPGSPKQLRSKFLGKTQRGCVDFWAGWKSTHVFLDRTFFRGFRLG